MIWDRQSMASLISCVVHPCSTQFMYSCAEAFVNRDLKYADFCFYGCIRIELWKIHREICGLVI